MKLSEQLKQDHLSGNFGKCFEGYSERAEALETDLEQCRQGFIDGIYMSACYCQKDHVCSPCQMKLQIVRNESLKEALAWIKASWCNDWGKMIVEFESHFGLE